MTIGPVYNVTQSGESRGNVKLGSAVIFSVLPSHEVSFVAVFNEVTYVITCDTEIKLSI